MSELRADLLKVREKVDQLIEKTFFLSLDRGAGDGQAPTPKGECPPRKLRASSHTSGRAGIDSDNLNKFVVSAFIPSNLCSD